MPMDAAGWGGGAFMDMREVIARVVDRSMSLRSTRREFGRTVLCGHARIGGRAVGIVANQKLNQSQQAAGPQAGEKRTELAG